jgi:hypothetical protein
LRASQYDALFRLHGAWFLRYPLAQPARHRVLTALIRTQHLFQE